MEKLIYRTKKKKKIKNSHVLIVGAGESLSRYSDDIRKFIKKNKNIVVIGCNHVSDFIIPDYHIWGDIRRYLLFGDRMDKKSVAVFPKYVFPNSIIKKYWSGTYKKINYKNSRREAVKKIRKKDKEYFYSEEFEIKKRKIREKKCKIRYRNGIIYGYFRAIGVLAIVWVHILKASKISIVGTDGYSLYYKDKYDKGINSQHCYQNYKVNEGTKNYNMFKKTGYTDVITYYPVNNEGDIKQNESKKNSCEKFYEHSLKKDKDVYDSLLSVNKFGIKFEILTPTVYKKFYNYKVFKNGI